MQKIHVFYHYLCIDGIFGALAAHLSKQEPEFTPFKHTDEMSYLELLGPEDVVYLVDVCGSERFLTEARAKSKVVYVLFSKHWRRGSSWRVGLHH